jgi:hypothetical protein
VTCGGGTRRPRRAAGRRRRSGANQPVTEPNADGSTTVYFGPKQPEEMKRGNLIQNMPNKGWFTILRLYRPLEPFFTKKWRPTEIELVK